MLTKQDFTQLQEIFVTNAKFEMAMWDMKEHIEEVFKRYRDTTLTSLSEVMGELKTIREEQTIGTYRQGQHSSQLADQEARILVLETKQL